MIRGRGIRGLRGTRQSTWEYMSRHRYKRWLITAHFPQMDDETAERTWDEKLADGIRRNIVIEGPIGQELLVCTSEPQTHFIVAEDEMNN